MTKSVFPVNEIVYWTSTDHDGTTIVHVNDSGYTIEMSVDKFTEVYKPNQMSFSSALEALKRGYKVARSGWNKVTCPGWNGIDMFVYRVESSKFSVNRAPLDRILPVGTEVTYQVHYDMKTYEGQFVPWVASQSDLDADDWYIVE